MPALLLRQPLSQRRHQRIEAAKRLDQTLLFLAQMLLGEPAKPVLRQGLEARPAFGARPVDTAERMGEDAVEAVDVSFVLDQRGTGQEVEALDVVVDEPRLQAFEEAEIFPQRGRHPGRLQLQEEGQ